MFPLSLVSPAATAAVPPSPATPTTRRAPLWRTFLGAGLAAALAGGLAVVPIARAATPSPLLVIAQALANATSYQVDITDTTDSATAPGGHATVVVVGNGTRARVHITLLYTKPPSDQHPYNEVIFDPSRGCQRTSAHAAFRCTRTTPAQLASSNVFLNPSSSLNGSHPVFTTAGTAPVGGRACARYAFREKSNADITGTLSVELATGRPCEFDDTIIMPPLTADGKPSTRRDTAIWSHFNDPSLIVPTVK